MFVCTILRPSERVGQEGLEPWGPGPRKGPSGARHGHIKYFCVYNLLHSKKLSMVFWLTKL